MPELRLILLLLGIGLIVGLYLWGRSAARKNNLDSPRGERFEPRIEGQELDEPVLDLCEDPAPAINRSQGANGAARVGEELSDAILAEPPTTDKHHGGESPRSPQADQKIIALRIKARPDHVIGGFEIVDVLRSQGLEYGKYSIFHRLDPDHRESVFSVASLVEPGAFDLDALHKIQIPGVSMFLILPGPQEGLAAFNDMLATARRVAERLDGDLLDAEGSSLSEQRASYLREEIIEFQHHLGVGRQAGRG